VICGLISGMGDNLSEAEKNHHRDLLIINAKVDALTAMVEILYLNRGSTREKFRSTLKTTRDAMIQKYLEKIQEKFPRLAAEIDWRETMPEIDQKLLDELRLDDEPD
jgi:hypothetical protein